MREKHSTGHWVGLILPIVVVIFIVSTVFSDVPWFLIYGMSFLYGLNYSRIYAAVTQKK